MVSFDPPHCHVSQGSVLKPEVSPTINSLWGEFISSQPVTVLGDPWGLTHLSLMSAVHGKNSHPYFSHKKTNHGVEEPWGPHSFSAAVRGLKARHPSSVLCTSLGHSSHAPSSRPPAQA